VVGQRAGEPIVLTLSWDTVRLFLQVLAATVWVGGQLTLAALVPTLRRFGADLPKAAARQFSRVAWPAFGVLIVTGVWNVVAERDKVTGEYRTTLVVKIVVVAVSGATAALHARSRSRTGLAVFRGAHGHQRLGCAAAGGAAGRLRTLASVKNERTTTAPVSAYGECRSCGVLGEVVPCACTSTLACDRAHEGQSSRPVPVARMRISERAVGI
jgi:hypothetical protein